MFISKCRYGDTHYPTGKMAAEKKNKLLKNDFYYKSANAKVKLITTEKYNKIFGTVFKIVDEMQKMGMSKIEKTPKKDIQASFKALKYHEASATMPPFQDLNPIYKTRHLWGFCFEFQ